MVTACIPLRGAPHLADRSDAVGVYRIRRLVSPTDEMIDLTNDQRREALQRTIRLYERQPDNSRHRAVPTRPSGPEIRRVRDTTNGLLLLYPLSETDDDRLPFVGFAASFPICQQGYPGRIRGEHRVLATGGIRYLNLSEVWERVWKRTPEFRAHRAECNVG